MRVSKSEVAPVSKNNQLGLITIHHKHEKMAYVSRTKKDQAQVTSPVKQTTNEVRATTSLETIRNLKWCLET